MVLPAITYNSVDKAHIFGLRQLFWAGRSNCAEAGGNFYCEFGDWLNTAGWNEMIRHYVGASRPDEFSKEDKEVLWMFIPDFE